MTIKTLNGHDRLSEMVDRQATDLLFQNDRNALVYLIHGVTGTPVEMRYLARGLARRGGDVYVTTLPGHCTSLRDLVKTNEQQWCNHVCKQLAYARERYERVYVAGLSAGALLSLEASTRVAVDGVGVLSPTFFYDGWNMPRYGDAFLSTLLKLVPESLQHLLFHVDGPPYGVKDSMIQTSIRASYTRSAVFHEWVSLWWEGHRSEVAGNGSDLSSAASKGYPLFPLRTLSEIDRLMNRVKGHLDNVSAPTVILQATDDDMTGPRNGQFVYDEIASMQKQIVRLDDCYHVITVDRQRQAVVTHLKEFFRLSTSAPAPEAIQFAAKC
ncbi:MAG: alpha/beta fold hydrolase [Nitrospirae bacterium]|nr:alpha/beta fold hydrolase [Nitrospirota bacterium]MBU6482157.1 alpha/beta fold hydrolase [Nitrospirota bacterium]MDE3042182.1 alpha/beta fold hydrolase [Nitrospirota bacterium]